MGALGHAHKAETRARADLLPLCFPLGYVCAVGRHRARTVKLVVSAVVALVLALILFGIFASNVDDSGAAGGTGGVNATNSFSRTLAELLALVSRA